MHPCSIPAQLLLHKLSKCSRNNGMDYGIRLIDHSRILAGQREGSQNSILARRLDQPPG